MDSFIDFLPVLIVLVPPLLFILIGMHVEKKMLRQIEIDEKALAHIKVTDTKAIPQEYLQQSACTTQMVCGGITIAENYLYSFFSSIRSIFGGSMNSYHKLLEIARRSAMIRMKKAAAELNSDCIVNMRCSTANIVGAQYVDTTIFNVNVLSVEVFMYGTAVISPK